MAHGMAYCHYSCPSLKPPEWQSCHVRVVLDRAAVLGGIVALQGLKPTSQLPASATVDCSCKQSFFL